MKIQNPARLLLRWWSRRDEADDATDEEVREAVEGLAP